jgi:TP901 family phage tail tape measure protein
MADVNANIGVNIDTSDALNQLKNLQRQISQFHQSVAKSSSTAAVAQRDLQKNFVNSVNAIQGFSAELRTVRSTAESFTNSLEKNKFSMREYFRYAAGATKTFGKNFGAEFSTIERTAIERVKTLQTQYIKMGRDAQGAMQAIAIRPTVLNMKDLGTQTAIAAQKQVLFNQLVKQGSTNLLNFGKNTQWAGRQLMVGFTLPLATLGMTAGRVFMDMEKAAIKFKKVYGDLFTAPEETQKAMDEITELGLAYTKYGVAVSDSLNVAADAAAAGFQGIDLQNQTTASLKLSVLGQMELQKALETTIALQNAFRISSQDLNGTIDFLNAVENQTVVSLDDITEATPRVATVIQALGGDVKDLAFFLAAMKEGGVNAAQGANALKSGLASLINPTERASELLNGMGVNIRAIVSENQGDLRGTVIGFARALDTLDPMNRARAIEQLFGKFQFARISALFDNVIREGSQASRVLDLAGSSLSDLATLSEKELGTQAASSMNKFTSAIERIKVALVPLGELFLDIATPFIDFGTKVLEAFNNLPDGMKKIIGTVITVLGGLGPILLMTFGLINNGIANMIKFFATVRLGYLKMTGQAKGIGDETQYMTQEQLEASAAAASLDQAHSNLTQRFTAEKTAVDALRDAYSQAAAAGARFAMLNPGMMKPGFAPTKMARGGVVTVGGRGNKDTEPALLTPGEAVIPAAMVKKYQPLIEGMIAGNIPGYAKGFLGMPKSAKSVSKGRDAAEEIYQMFLKSSYANTAPTEYGHQISPTSGHSFPIFGLGGVYQKGNKQVFVKPVLDEKAALAEMRSTEISRRAHGLEAPEQRIVVMRDPMDVKRQRRFLALESDLDPKFVNNQPMGVFNEEQYFRQLVASLLRVDKDLSGSNVYGNVVADAGPSGVFSRASGLRDYEKNLPSMEEQALINLLGIKGGAKRAFAESTLGMMAGITPEQYRQRMLGEIQKVLPRLKETIASFKLTNPTEVGVYDDMIRRLEQGLGVDWSKFHAVHSAVKIPKPKAGTQTMPGYKNGVVSVPGPKGAGDVMAAMLSPGEAVIPAEMAKRYAPLIQGMIAGNIPGYALGKQDQATFGKSGAVPLEASHLDKFAPKEFLNFIRELVQLQPELAGLQKEVFLLGEKAADGTREVRKVTMSLEEIANLPDTTELLSGGYAASGTTILETQQRNQSYDVAGFAGVPTSLAGVVEAGRLAEETLLSGSNESKKWEEGLRQLVAEGKEAAAAQASSTAAQQDLDYTLKIAEKTYAEGLVSSGQERDATKAATKAAERMTTTRTQYAEDLKNGMTEEQALRRARIRALGAASIEAGTGEFAAGPAGTGAQDLRQISSGRGGSSFRRVDMGPEETRRFAARGLEPKALGVELYNAEFEKLGQEFTVEGAKSFFAGAKQGLRIASPSQEIAEIAQAVTDGVDLVKPEAEKAGQDLGKTITQSGKNAAGSAFGNINTKEPVPAVGNAPREVTAAMQKESTAARTFAGDIKASFANVRSNLAREMGFVKEEFASIVQQIKQKFNVGGKEIVAVAQNTNQGLVINGKNYGVNAIAQAQGRDGAIESILTRKNAEILSKIAAAYNAGTLEIPRVIGDGIKSQNDFLGLVGGGIATEIAKAASKKIGQDAAAMIPSYAVAAPLMGAMQGPGEDPAAREARMNTLAKDQLINLQKTSSQLSAFSFGLSSLTGVISAFGLDLGGVMPILSGLTGAIFALTSITALLTQAKTSELIATKLKVIGDGTLLGGIRPLITSFKGGAKGLTGFSNIIKGVAGAFKNLFPTIARLLPLIGLAVAAFSIFQIASSIIEENNRKLRGLSDAADMSAEKIKKLGAAAGQENVLEKASFKTEDTSAAKAAPLAAADKKSANLVIESEGGIEEFKKEYANEIKAIENAKGDQERLLAVYRSMAIQFNALGIEGPAIESIINALKMGAQETDVVLDFKSLTIFDDAGNIDISAIQNRAKASVVAFDAAAKAAQDRIQAQNAANQNTSENMFYGAGSGASSSFDPYSTQAPAADAESSIVQTETIAATTGELKALRAAFEAGTISQIDYQAATNASIAPLKEMGDESQNLTDLLTKMEVDPGTVTGLETIAEKTAILNAALAGIDVTAFAEGLKSKDIRAKAAAFRALEKATADATKEQEAANVATNYENAVSPLEDQITALEQQIQVYDDVVASTGDVALAQQIAGDESLRAAYAAALAADVLAGAINGQGAAVTQLFADIAKLNSLQATVSGRSSSGGGGGRKSPFQEAIDKLKEQKKEITSNINAYAKLRNAGFGVSEASELAADSTLAVALAAQKVGSKGYNDLLQKIKQVKQAQDELASVDPQTGTDRFNEAFGKLNAYFDSQEALLDASNEAATKTNRDLIETLEDQIEGYNRQIGAFDRDLDKIADKEAAINKTYDEKTKALETVKKLNQDIINQQKSQLSIADALSQGNISAAASAMQDARAQNAAAQGDATGTALDAARQAQLNSLKENGLTRAEIEDKIKNLKKTISDIEIGSLRTAQDAVKAADDANESAKLLLDYKEKTRKEWQDEALAVEAAKDKALVYEKGVHAALLTAEDLVKQWKNLDTTITTNHVINEIRTYSGGGSPPPPPPPTTPASTPGALNWKPFVPTRSGMVGNGRMGYAAKGGYIKPSYMDNGGFAQFARGTDTVPTMLTPGEFVVNSASSKRFGPMLEAMNNGSFKYYTPTAPIVPNNFSQPVYNMPSRSYAGADSPGGIYPTSNISPSLTAQDNSVYNYSLSVNVEGTNTSANDIANVVMNKIKNIQSQQVRGQVLR